MTGHCADCGEQLDQFGICPFAEPKRARTERAPVNCGHTPAENTRALGRLIQGDRWTPVVRSFGGDAT